MAIRTILHYPDKRLRIPGEKVDPARISDKAIQTLIDDMAETMYAAPGVGLAATQIGVALQLFIVDVAGEDEPSDLRVFINPEIIEKVDAIVWSEGCLSFPGITEEIERAAHIRARAFDRDGKLFEIEAGELLAVAIQHEYDHLLGKLMIDHLGPLKKRLLHRKMQKRAEATSSV
ncbi:MAG TPA: peptide deformylase [Polyangiaceae bacterium]|nr:peptide deformylase [Polyangiaceae bacterium]